MNETEAVLSIVREWVAKAENDLRNAIHTLELEDDCPTDTVCFHAQQCVEKYMKATLVWKGIDFQKIHKIENLVDLLPEDLRPNLNRGEQSRFTEYATVTRYPGDYEPIPLTEAQEAVSTAQRVRKHFRRSLPKKVLRRREAS